MKLHSLQQKLANRSQKGIAIWVILLVIALITFIGIAIAAGTVGGDTQLVDKKQAQLDADTVVNQLGSLTNAARISLAARSICVGIPASKTGTNNPLSAECPAGSVQAYLDSSASNGNRQLNEVDSNAIGLRSTGAVYLPKNLQFPADPAASAYRFSDGSHNDRKYIFAVMPVDAYTTSVCNKINASSGVDVVVGAFDNIANGSPMAFGPTWLPRLRDSANAQQVALDSEKGIACLDNYNGDVTLPRAYVIHAKLKNTLN